MKAWFGPKLEPGERVVLRHLPGWLYLPLHGLAIYLIFYPLAAFYRQGRLDDPNVQFLVGLSAIMGAILLACGLFAQLRIWTVVTDRRVLRPQEPFRSAGIDEIRLKEIHQIYHNGHAVVVHADWRKLDIPCPFPFQYRLLKALTR